MFGALSIVIALAVLTGFAQLSNTSSNTKSESKKSQKVDALKNIKSSQCKFVVTNEQEIDMPLGSTKFGGSPHVGSHFTWPIIDETPYLFLGQVNFEQLREKYRHGALPHEGILYMFIKPHMTFSNSSSDGLNAKFVYLEALPEEATSISTDYTTLNELSITMLPQPSYLPVDDAQVVQCELNEDELEEYLTFLTNEVSHQKSPKFCGHPDLHHNLMPERCQSSSTNVSLDNIGELSKEETDIFNIGKHQWIHLMQLPSDMFDDYDELPNGMYHFYIRRSDLLAKNFTKIWTIKG